MFTNAPPLFSTKASTKLACDKSGLFCKRSPLKYKSLTKECLHKYNKTTIKTFSASSIFSLLSHFSCRTYAFSYPSFLWTDSRKRPPCFWRKTQKKADQWFLPSCIFLYNSQHWLDTVLLEVTLERLQHQNNLNRPTNRESNHSKLAANDSALQVGQSLQCWGAEQFIVLSCFIFPNCLIRKITALSSQGSQATDTLFRQRIRDELIHLNLVF